MAGFQMSTEGEAGLQSGPVPTLKQVEDRFTKTTRIRCAEKPSTFSFYENKLRSLIAFGPLTNAPSHRGL
jgi:hypothetical protein